MNSIFVFFERFFGLFKWWVIISPWEQSVRVRLGRHAKLMGPGVHLAIPIVDRFYIQSIRHRVINLQNRTVTTADGKTIVIGAQLGYEVCDVMRLYQTLHDARATLENRAAGAIAEYVASHTLEECSPLRVASAAADMLGFEEYGIGNVDLQVDDYVVVPRTLRLVTGMGERYTNSDGLDTGRFVAGGVSGQPAIY